MKTVFLMLLLLLSVGAFGQCCSVIAPPQMTSPWSWPDHSMRASRHSLAPEFDLQEAGGATMAQGERPAWEIFNAPTIPLGDIARDYRKEHLIAKKARIVWEQVGR